MANRNETFDVEGVDELAAALARVGSEDRKRFMRTGFDEASAFILHDMKQRAPRRSGDLARNLTRQLVIRKGEVTSANIGPRSKGKRDRWWSDLARWQELGTRASVAKPRRKKAVLTPEGPRASTPNRQGVTAQPFMRPSVDNNVNRIANIMVSSIAAALRRAGFTVTAR